MAAPGQQQYFNLCRGELIGRLDAKAHRAQGVFEVKALYAQSAVKWTNEQVRDIAMAIKQCAMWHDTPDVHIAVTQPNGVTAELAREIKQLVASASS